MSLNLKYATIIVLFLHFSCTQKEEKNNLLDMQTLDYAGEENACVFDDNDDFEKAQSLAPTEEGSPLRTTTGYLCPVSDQDWYRFDNQKGILSVSLKSSTQITPIQPIFEIWSIFQNQAVADRLDEVVISPTFSSRPNLEQRFCVPEKALALRVYDLGNDAQDKRNEYELTLMSYEEVDTHEKQKRDQVLWDNGVVSEYSIRNLEKSTSADQIQYSKGYISCIGDQDWFKVELQKQQILHWRFKMGASLVLPKIKLWNSVGDLVLEQRGQRGDSPDLMVEKTVIIDSNDTYYISISDLDELYSSIDVFYEFGIWIEQEPDLNEPNDIPSKATNVLADGMKLMCGTEWSDWQIKTGFISSPGDQDWFKVDVEGCSKGLVEVEAVLINEGLEAQQSFNLQKELNLEIALIKSHLQSDCVTDNDCQELNLSCENLWDCAGSSTTCLASGRCAGASFCLSDQKCGGLQLQRHYELPANATPLALPPHRVKTAFPLFSDQSFYLRVGDFAANAGHSKANYELKFRVIQEKDTHEPSNRYTDQVRATDPIGPNLEKGRNGLISVFDCSASHTIPEGQTAGGNSLQAGCCMDSMEEWVEGYISYEGDEDFYAYEHPCPNGDCMVKIYYDIDEGAVDMLWQVYLDSGLWFDPIVPVQELAQSDRIVGSFGGVDQGDQCFYAWQGHLASPYYYYLSIRDFGEKKDWSSSQKYRVCIEKVADGCFEPPCRYTAPMDGITKPGCGVPPR